MMLRAYARGNLVHRGRFLLKVVQIRLRGEMLR